MNVSTGDAGTMDTVTSRMTGKWVIVGANAVIAHGVIRAKAVYGA